MKHNGESADKYVIRNATLKLDDYIVFICAPGILYLIIKNQSSAFIIVAFLGMLGLITYWTIKRHLDRSDKIIIDKSGIKLCETNEFIACPNIKYAYIKLETEGIGRNARVVDYFHIHTKSGEIKVRMCDFSYKKDLLVESIESFSGRNIGDFTDLVNDNARTILGNDRNVDRISKIMKEFYKRQTYLSLISLLTLIGISIYLQVKIDFPYVFAIGFTFTLGFLYLIEILEVKRLRNQEYLWELDDKKFKAIKKEYGQDYDFELTKGRKIALIIFLTALIIGIFMLSYLLDKG